ncbi:MAG: tryptophan synthase subunit alpha [Candidatus Velthaea sp.]
MIVQDDRIAAVFERARRERRAALIVYLMAGDPDLETTARTIDAVSAAGADLIELGIPYGDPLADGPTVAAAGQRALHAGATIRGALDIVAGATARGAAPLLFFTYVNPVAQYGPAAFAAAARNAGAVGAIVPDVPLEEIDAFAPAFRAEGLALPLLVAPTTPPARAAQIAARSDGFIYLVSRLGVTGARREPDIGWIEDAVARLRTATTKPVAVGFGISTPAHVRAVAAVADGVIVGSALIDAMYGRNGVSAAHAAEAYVASLRAAL